MGRSLINTNWVTLMVPSPLSVPCLLGGVMPTAYRGQGADQAHFSSEVIPHQFLTLGFEPDKAKPSQTSWHQTRPSFKKYSVQGRIFCQQYRFPQGVSSWEATPDLNPSQEARTNSLFEVSRNRNDTDRVHSWVLRESPELKETCEVQEDMGQITALPADLDFHIGCV